MPQNKIIERIERELGVSNLAEMLGERLSPTDLQSLMLDVYARQADRRTPAHVLADYENNRFVQPSGISPLELARWEQSAFAALPPDFEAIALSPVVPLGACSVVAAVDQNRVISTGRNSEVMADSTNVLALEAARRRKMTLRSDPKSAIPVHLAASHRLIRAQQYANNPRSVPHFNAFALCSSGRDTGRWQFEMTTLVQHISFYLRALRVYSGNIPLKLAFTDLRANNEASEFSETLFAAVRAQVAGVEAVIDQERVSGRGYYADFCFHIYAANQSGEWLELADGGSVDWTQKLLSNTKERCVISGIGAERVCAEFKPS